MAKTSICRLCVTACEDYKNLYKKNGEGNGLYKMTLEYFHPKIVDLNEATHLRVLCLQCFRNIYDFHSFQTSVSLAQLKLFEESIVKIETDDDDWEDIEDTENKTIPNHDEVVEKQAKVKETVCSIDQSFRTTTNKLEKETKEICKAPTSASVLTKVQTDTSNTITRPKTKNKLKANHQSGSDLKSPAAGEGLKDCGKNEKTTPTRETRQMKRDSLNKEATLSNSDSTAAEHSQKIDFLAKQFNLQLNGSENVKPVKKPNRRFNCKVYKTILKSQLKNHYPEGIPSYGHYYYDEKRKIFHCKQCEQTFRYKKILMRHILRRHPHISYNKVTAEGRYMCTLCGSSYTYRTGFLGHLRTVHPEARRKKPSACDNSDFDYDNVTKRIKCKICDNSYVNKWVLKQHMERQHCETQASSQQLYYDYDKAKRMFQCKLCSNTYIYKSKIVLHVTRQHWQVLDAQTIYKCKKCSKAFCTKLALHNHDVAIHDPSARYPCRDCGKSFRKKLGLSKHKCYQIRLRS